VSRAASLGQCVLPETEVCFLMSGGGGGKRGGRADVGPPSREGHSTAVLLEGRPHLKPKGRGESLGKLFVSLLIIGPEEYTSFSSR